MDYKSVFTNLCLKLQQNRSWIKGLGKNPFTHSIPFHSIHSFPDGSAFCPGAPKRVPSDSEKHRRVYTSSNVCHSHEWRVDTASGMTIKKQNASDMRSKKKLRVYTASEVKGLRTNTVTFWLQSLQLGTPSTQFKLWHPDWLNLPINVKLKGSLLKQTFTRGKHHETNQCKMAVTPNSMFPVRSYLWFSCSWAPVPSANLCPDVGFLLR